MVVCAAYLYVLNVNGTVLSLWQSPSLIRLPFLFTTAAFFGYLIDRSRRDQRRAREQAYADLERLVAQRTADLTATNQELSAFAYSVSHDLRASLRAIDAFSQALIEDYGDVIDPHGQDYLRRVRANAGRMSQLIDDLLQLSRLTRAEMHSEPIDLSGMARIIASDLQRTDPKRSATFNIESGVTACGDPRLVRVLLENLIGNAWKYTSRHPSAQIAFGRSSNDGEVAYFVRDDGAGFDIAYADKLFRPFQRLHTMEGSRRRCRSRHRTAHRPPSRRPHLPTPRRNRVRRSSSPCRRSSKIPEHARAARQRRVEFHHSDTATRRFPSLCASVPLW